MKSDEEPVEVNLKKKKTIFYLRIEVVVDDIEWHVSGELNDVLAVPISEFRHHKESLKFFYF